MALLMRVEHLLLMTWLLWLQDLRDGGTHAQTVCPRDEPRCHIRADASIIFRMTCSSYGSVQQLPRACNEPRVISNLVIGQNTTVTALQSRILDGLRMRHLELVGLGIRSVSVSAFEAISSDLQVLHLQDNQLESLPLGVFGTLVRLSRLQLHNNRLTELSDGLFSGLSNLIYLTLNVNRISTVDPGTWYALPRLVTLTLEDNRLSDGRLRFPYMALDKLEELRLDKNGLTTINEDILAELPNLRKLYFRWNGVESLPRKVFRNNLRLREVDLTKNNITRLVAASFNDSMSLETLVLDENHIRQLPNSLFLSLNTLRTLRLRENDISDVYSNSFTGLVGLRELDLSGNKIPTLPLGMFDPLGLLETLSLANNEIEHVEKMPFQSCRHLRTLDLADNLLPAVNADWFNATTEITVVKLAHNRIESIQLGSFDKLQRLEELDLRENYLSDLRRDLFVRCRSLRKLNLARNPLRKLASPGTTFNGLTALQRLDLTRCCITELTLNSSAPLPSLTELHLSDNLLTEVQRHSLEAATNLQTVDLADNSISVVEAGALSPLASLNSLNLSHNLLTEDQLSVVVRSVPSDAIVDASWNHVRSLASLTTPLRGIYLSGNPLVCSCMSPSWISADNAGTFLDSTKTVCSSGRTSAYLLCYWSRSCSPVFDHELCRADVPPETNFSTAGLPSKMCRLDAALTVFGPRFTTFDAQPLSPTSAQLGWNITDEFDTAAGYQLTFTAIDNCTNLTAAIFALTGNETSFTTHVYDVNSTSVDVGTLTSGPTYLACADVLQMPTGNSNRTAISDTQCTCLELPKQTTTTSSTTTTTTPTTTTTTTTTSTTTTPTTTTSTTTTTPTTTTTTPTTTTTTTTPTTTTTTTTPTTTTTTTTVPPTLPPLTTTTESRTSTSTTTTIPTTTTSTTTTTTSTTSTTTTPSPTTTTTRPVTTKPVKTAAVVAISTKATDTATTTVVYATTTATMELMIQATANQTVILVTWSVENPVDNIEYFWLICFDDDSRQVMSKDVRGDSHMIENLLPGSAYNVCITTVTHQDGMDLTRCVMVETVDRETKFDVTVRPSTKDDDDSSLFLLIVIAVPIAGLLLVLLILCIAIVFYFRRRGRRRRRLNKPAEAEMTSSSTYDSSTGNCATCASGTSSPLSEQAVTTLNLYDEVYPSAPPPPTVTAEMSWADRRYWNNTSDPLPLQSSLSLNVYDESLSY